MSKPISHPSVASENDDPLAVVVKLETAIEFSMRGSGTQTSYVALDRRTGKYFRFGVAEYHAVSLMDGQRRLADVHEQLAEDGVLWSPTDVVAFAKELAKQGLASIERTAGEPPSEPPDGGAPTPRKPPLGLRVLGSLLTQRIPLVDGDRTATKLLPIIGPLFSTTAMIGWVALVASGIGIVWSEHQAFSAEIHRVFDRQLWLIIAAIWCVLKVLHEVGHAVAAKRLGVRVGPMGVMFFLMAPLAYVDVTDAWKLPRRRDRILIALAGVYLELAVGAVAAWCWWSAGPGFAKHFAAQVFLVAGPATLLVNANPLLRLDGYYVLSDLLEIPNLRQHGRRRLVAVIERVLFQLPAPESQLRGWRNDFALVHALGSVLFQVVWMGGLIIAVAHWMKGLGIVLAVAAGLVWGIIPLLRWMYKIWTIQARQGWVLNVYQRRLLALVAFAAMLLQLAAVQTSPFSRRVPVVVRFQDEQIARAPVDAFVAAVYVQCGERIERGMLLMELSQPELVLKRDQLVDQRDASIGKTIRHQRRDEIALAKASTEKTQSLARQILEIEEQLESLRVIAERAGKVSSPHTDRLLGQYVKSGDELIRVSDPQEKEVLAVVAEDDLDAYNLAVDSQDRAKIRLRGGVTLETALTPLQPAASKRLPHPALAATVGGPLGIEMSGDGDDPQMVLPHLQSVIPLDALNSMAVRAGQIGRLAIPDNRTLWSRLLDYLLADE